MSDLDNTIAFIGTSSPHQEDETSRVGVIGLLTARTIDRYHFHFTMTDDQLQALESWAIRWP